MNPQDPDPTSVLISKLTGAVTQGDLRENLANPVLRTLRYLLGVPEHFTGMVFDWFSHVREVNLVKFATRLDKVLREKTIENPRPLPPGPAMAAINTVSLQTDEDLQERWAEILSKAMDPTVDYSLKMAHVATLSEMDVLDAQILDLMCRRPCTALANCIVGTDLDVTGTTKALVVSELATSRSSFGEAQSNLVRLGVVGLTGIDITPFGQNFWRSVTPGEKQFCPFGFTELDKQWRDLWTHASKSREAALQSMGMHPSNEMFSFAVE